MLARLPSRLAFLASACGAGALAGALGEAGPFTASGAGFKAARCQWQEPVEE